MRVRQASTLLPHIGAFILVTVWDYLAAVNTIYTADRASIAVMFASLNTAIWFGAVRLVANRTAFAFTFITGAALGTWLGIRFS